MIDQSMSEIFARADEKRSYSARRSQLEIQMDILKVVHDGAFLPTQIMYRANLAWVSLQESLGTLVKSGLLERAVEGSRRTYQLTARGSNILNSFRVIIEAVATTDAKLRAG